MKMGYITHTKPGSPKSYDRNNELHPLMGQMQAFSDDTNFRKFFKKNARTYGRFVKIFKKSADVMEMKDWLAGNFQDLPEYDFYRIIFSPLTSYNSTFTSFESNGFRELQPHLGFPYWYKPKRFFWESDSKDLFSLSRNIFMELNMGYVTPEFEKFRGQIMAATSHTDLWAGEGLSLRGGYVFKQYMKRALVSLHIMDNFQEEDQRKMIENNVMVMVDSHFHQFEAFNSFLMELYDNKSPQTTVSDLFPEIIEWFEKHNH